MATATKIRTSDSGTSPWKVSDYATGAVIGAAAAGIAVGLAANVARKLAVQAPTYFAGEWDEALEAEHQATLKLFDALEATSDTQMIRRTMLLTQLKHALAKHALQEESVIYPALRDAGMKDEADGLNADHGYVKQYLYDLSEMPRDSWAFVEKVRAFRRDIEKHMKEEEDTLFPKLRAAISDEKTRELTGLMNREGLKIA